MDDIPKHSHNSVTRRNIHPQVKKHFLLAKKYLSGKSPANINITRAVSMTSMQAGSQEEWTGMHMCEQ